MAAVTRKEQRGSSFVQDLCLTQGEPTTATAFEFLNSSVVMAVK